MPEPVRREDRPPVLLPPPPRPVEPPVAPPKKSSISTVSATTVAAEKLSLLSEALREACAVPGAPGRSLGWAARPLPHEPAALGERLLAEVARRGLAETERSVAQHEAGLPWLNRHEGEQHPCDGATVAFAKAYLGRLRARQKVVRAEMTPHLVALATASINESEARIRGFASHYGVEMGDRVPPPAGSTAAERQASLQSASRRLLAAHEALTDASDPRSEQEKHLAFELLHAELSLEHSMLSGFGPGANLDLLVSLTKASAPRTLQRVLAEHLVNAAALKQKVEDDPQVVWQMAPLVEGLLNARGLPKGHPDRLVARESIAEELGGPDTQRSFISLISLGLVAAGVVVQGPIGLGLAAAGAVLDLADFAIFASRHALHETANRVDLDPRRNLSAVPTSRGELVFESLILSVSVAGFAGSELSRLTQAADAHAGSRFLGAVGREHGEATRLAVYAVLEEHGLLGDLHRLSDGAADFAAQHPGRFAALVAENPRALFGSESELGRSLLESRMTRLLALGEDGRRALRPRELDALIDFPPELLLHLDAPQARGIVELVQRVGTEQGEALARAFGPKNVAPLVRHLDPARLRLDGSRVTVDGRLSLHPQELAPLAHKGELPNLLARLERLQDAELGALGNATLNRDQLKGMEEAARKLAANEPLSEKTLRTLAGSIGADPVVLRQVIERMAHVDQKLSAEAAQLVEAAPALRSALLHLESLTEIPDALKVRVLSTLERAVGPNRSSFDLENLSTHVFEALKSGPRRLETAIDELEHGLRVAEKPGEIMEGSRVWLGLKPGEGAQLSDGVKVELPPPEKGKLQDIDVLYLRPDGTVQAVEVKRQDVTLAEALAKDDEYLEKYRFWRDKDNPGQRRAVAFAFSNPWTEALERAPRGREGTLGAWLEENAFEVREVNW